jgi:hypothetical protein
MLYFFSIVSLLAKMYFVSLHACNVNAALQLNTAGTQPAAVRALFGAAAMMGEFALAMLSDIAEMPDATLLKERLYAKCLNNFPRVALALAAHYGWQLRQLDVQTAGAFIQSPVNEELY